MPRIGPARCDGGSSGLDWALTPDSLQAHYNLGQGIARLPEPSCAYRDAVERARQRLPDDARTAQNAARAGILRGMTTPDAPTTPNNEKVLFEGYPSVIPGALALLIATLTLGLALIYFFVRSRQTHYKITTQRIIIKRGILSKKMDQVDTYRINDFVVERPFGQRLMGTCNIVLTSMDRSNPEVHINGIRTDVLALYEQLRVATEDQKIRRGVRTLDASEHHV